MKQNLMEKLLQDMDLLRNSYANNSSHDFGHKRIMVIDDCSITLTMINKILRNCSNLNLELFRDERAALKSFMELSPDVVILDMNLQSLDGPTVAQIMKSLAVFEVPIIFISADVDKEADIKIDGWRKTTFLSKPLRKNSLISTIDEICAPVAA
tara:strand:+ start:4381 stop:4842 length:462 start_codon:yes stop_codon:yes gene_type:complete